MTPKQIAYSFYLKSDHWRELRDAVIKRDGAKCVECGSKYDLTAHHKFYRKRFEHSMPSDLITLCEKCHAEKHKIVKDENGAVVSMVQMPGMKRFRMEMPIKNQKRQWLKKRKKRIKQWNQKRVRLGWSF